MSNFKFLERLNVSWKNSPKVFCGSCDAISPHPVPEYWLVSSCIEINYEFVFRGILKFQIIQSLIIISFYEKIKTLWPDILRPGGNPLKSRWEVHLPHSLPQTEYLDGKSGKEKVFSRIFFGAESEFNTNFQIEIIFWRYVYKVQVLKGSCIMWSRPVSQNFENML